MRQISFNSESGVILPIVIILMIALIITGIAFLNAAVMENRLVQREVYKNKAFYIAEGGLERTIWNLKQDFVSGNKDWTDGTDGINGISVGDPDTDGWRILDYDESSLSLGAGIYEVKLKYVYDVYNEAGEPIGPPRKDRIWVRSKGTTVKNISRTVEIYVKAINVSPWNNAIFAGEGSVAGMVIEGCAKIHGSVRILGNGLLLPTDPAVDFSGDAGIRNNYEGMPAELKSKVPNGYNTYTLDAALHVKRGKVGLSGSATVGEPEAGSSFEENMDAVYVCVSDGTSGYRGNQGVNNVYSKNPAETPYDPDDTMEFPELDHLYINPVTEEPYYNPITGEYNLTYRHYLQHCAVHVESLDEISSSGTVFPPGGYSSVVPYDDPVTEDLGKESSITWSWDEAEGTGTLTVNGVVWVDNGVNGVLDLGKKNERIEYEGSGVIVVGDSIDSVDGVDGKIRVLADLVAKGDYSSGGGFPKHVLGLIANDIDLAPEPCDSRLTMTGAFYAKEQIFSAKQNEVAGTFVSNVFDMGGQVPRIYQVPELQNELPPGMPGGSSNWHVVTSLWREL